jgi:hypothetical protein
MQYPHYDPNPLYMVERNAIPATQFKDVHYMWGQNAYPHYDLNPHCIWEKEIQYLHDNLKMHTVCGWKNAINLNPHYLWEAKC